MARVILIFIVLLAFTMAMYGLAHLPSLARRPATDEPVATLPLSPAPAIEPKFASAKVDDKGAASITGTAAPESEISILAGETAVGSTTSDAKGDWALTLTSPFPEGQLELTVSAHDAKGNETPGKGRLLIAPPPDGTGTPHVTLKLAGEDDRVMQEGTKAVVAQTGLIVDKASQRGDGGIDLAGRADPGATVRVVLNNKPSGEVVVGNDGAWSISAENKSRKTKLAVRLELRAPDGKVLDRADFPFKTATNAPAKPAEPATPTTPTTPTTPSEPSTPAAAPSNPTSVAGTTIRVRRGQSLWRIARRHTGRGATWEKIYEANKDKIGNNPDYIKPGTVLVIPSA